MLKPANHTPLVFLADPEIDAGANPTPDGDGCQRGQPVRLATFRQSWSADKRRAAMAAACLPFGAIRSSRHNIGEDNPHIRKT
jgi:hypothetical protein